MRKKKIKKLVKELSKKSGLDLIKSTHSSETEYRRKPYNFEEFLQLAEKVRQIVLAESKDSDSQ